MGWKKESALIFFFMIRNNRLIEKEDFINSKTLSQKKEGFFKTMTDVNKLEITKEGLVTLQKELDELVTIKRPKLVERLSNARQQGDLAENSDYQNAKDEL
jgi:hypothetical protein